LKAKGINFESESVTEASHFFRNGSKWILFRGPDNEHLELNETFASSKYYEIEES